MKEGSRPGWGRGEDSGDPARTHLELRGVVPQLDLQQEPVFPHLVLRLLLQLLHQALQELGGLVLVLVIFWIDGIPWGGAG